MITTVKSIGRTVKVVQDGTPNLKSEWPGWRVQGSSGFKVQGSRFRAQGSKAQGSSIQGPRSVQGSRVRRFMPALSPAPLTSHELLSLDFALSPPKDVGLLCVFGGSRVTARGRAHGRRRQHLQRDAPGVRRSGPYCSASIPASGISSPTPSGRSSCPARCRWTTARSRSSPGYRVQYNITLGPGQGRHPLPPGCHRSMKSRRWRHG